MITYDESFYQGTSYQNESFIFDRPIFTGKKYHINFLKSYLWDWFYKFILWLFPVSNNENKYRLSLCTIFKNEAPFIKEWLEYHLLIGVEHFYLYNNNSDDDFMSTLAPYIKNGIVTLIEWPDKPGQLSSYKHWYDNYRNETQWVSYLDLDEYICPRYNNSVITWLKKYEKYPVVMVYWKMFGTSGIISHDFDKLTIEQYTNSWEKLTNIGKLFYNTKYEIETFHIGMMHTFNVRFRNIVIPPINQFGRFVKYNIHRAISQKEDIQINHYWSKSYKSYLAKHKRGDAAFEKSPRDYDYFLWHETRNTSSDFSIFRFIIPLKQKMNLF